MAHWRTATVPIIMTLHRSTSLTTTRFSAYFVSIGHFIGGVMMAGSFGGVRGDGSMNIGGTNSHMYTSAKDGETSYSSPHPTWVFASSVHTIWHAHCRHAGTHSSLFHLPSLTFMEIARSQGIVVLAVEKRNRVCRVRLQMPIPNLRKAITAINEDYPTLEAGTLDHDVFDRRWYDHG